MLSVNDINLSQRQNEGLKKQNKELQEENLQLKQKIGAIKVCLNDFATKFDNIFKYVDELEVRSRLDDLRKLTYEFLDFVEEVK